MQSKSVLILLAMNQAFMAFGDCGDGGDNCPAGTVDLAQSSALLAKQATRASSSHATEEESDQDTSDGKKQCKTDKCQTALDKCITDEINGAADPRVKIIAAGTCLEAGQAEPWPGALKKKQPHHMVVAKCSLCVVVSSGHDLTAQTCDEARSACTSDGTGAMSIINCVGLLPAKCHSD